LKYRFTFPIFLAVLGLILQLSDVSYFGGLFTGMSIGISVTGFYLDCYEEKEVEED
jgi:hypothetical protein